MTTLSRTTALFCGLLLATGCTETVSPDHADDDAAEAGMAAELANERPFTITDVALDAALADLCAVRSTFEVDPTRDEARADPSVAALASCITSGPLQGRSLELIAHTSAHHDSKYDRRRGESRAESLRNLLIENGVSQDDVRSSAAVAGDERSVEVRVVPQHAR
jgi:outer membrane protein OmpA-like peptidoglycan-associated protein